jgi:hypothetical protein
MKNIKLNYSLLLTTLNIEYINNKNVDIINKINKYNEFIEIIKPYINIRILKCGIL